MRILRKLLTVLLVVCVLSGAAYLGHQYYLENTVSGQWEIDYTAYYQEGEGVLFPDKIADDFPAENAVYDFSGNGKISIISDQYQWDGTYKKDTSVLEIKDTEGKERLRLNYRVGNGSMIWTFTNSGRNTDPQNYLMRLVKHKEVQNGNDFLNAGETQGTTLLSGKGKNSDSAGNETGTEAISWIIPEKEVFSYEILPDETVRITDCMNLADITQVQLPDELYGYTVTELGQHAFDRCTEISAVRLPAALRNIEGNPFAGCVHLSTVETDPDCTVFMSDGHRLVDKVKHELIMVYGKVTEEEELLSEEFVSIAEQAFVNAVGLETLVIPDTILSIGNRAFEGSGIRQAELGGNLIHIGDYAFMKTAIASLRLPGSVSSIGANPFGGFMVEPEEGSQFFKAEKEMLIDLKNQRLVSCWSRSKNFDETAFSKEVKEIGAGAFSDTGVSEISIPEGVETIRDEAFRNNPFINIITLPDSLTYIGRSAFSGCTALKEMTVPGQITRIEEAAFKNCTELETVYLPASLTYIGAEAFCGDEWLTAAALPEQLTQIGPRAFAGCLRLPEITFPDSLTGIGAEAFSGCSELQTLQLPKALGTIEDGAFTGCPALASIEAAEENPYFRIEEGALIREADQCLLLYPPAREEEDIILPEGIVSIGSGAFDECTYLSSIQLPEGVRKIGDNAFRPQSSLIITLPASIEQIGEDAFAPSETTDFSEVKCYVHKGTLAESYCREHEVEYAVIPEE